MLILSEHNGDTHSQPRSELRLYYDKAACELMHGFVYMASVKVAVLLALLRGMILPSHANCAVLYPKAALPRGFW